jgi:putative PIN family toxin of toxin-antitoxin system
MPRVFVDTSVLFAAAYSSTGFARDLIRLALEKRVTLVLSQDVLAEAERNLGKKAPDQLVLLNEFLAALELEIVPSPPAERVAEAAQYVAQKDAIIVAAAIQAEPDYVATYDREHLLDPPEVAAKSGLTIVTPDIVVREIQESD